MYSDFKNLNEIIYNNKEFEKFRSAIAKQDVINKFYEIFPDLKTVIVPVKVERKILFLRVENSVWRSELNFRKALLIEKINSFFESDLVKGIKFI